MQHRDVRKKFTVGDFLNPTTGVKAWFSLGTATHSWVLIKPR